MCGKQIKHAQTTYTTTGTTDALRTFSHMERLSNELLLTILDCVRTASLECNLNTFVALCLTNRRMHELATEYLYEHVNVSNLRPPSKFLRTIIANPQLARQVKAITWIFPENPRRIEHDPVPSGEERRKLWASLERLSITNPAFLEGAYFEGYCAQMLQVALLHTPNLRELTVLDDGLPVTNSYFTPPDAAIGKWSAPGPVCPHLHSVLLSMKGLLLNDIAPILCSPALRKLQLSHINTFHVNEFLVGERRDQSNVTDILIKDSSCDAGVLAHLIAACRRLETFVLTYDFAYEFSNPIITNDWYPILIDALRKHEKTLEKLVLDDDTDRERQFLRFKRGELGDLTTFSKLQHLSVPIEAFLVERAAGGNGPFVRFSDVLPASLCRLCVSVFWNHHTEFFAETLFALASSVPTHFPRLREFELRRLVPVYLECLALEGPGAELRRRGVNLCVTQNGVPEPDLPEPVPKRRS